MTTKKIIAKKSKKNKNTTTTLWLMIAGVILFAALYFLFRIFGPNTASFGNEKYFYVATGSTYSDVLRGLKKQGIIKNTKSFNWVANKLDYPDHVHAGRYEIHAGMSNFKIARLLRSGRQTPVKLVINKLRTKADFIRLVCHNLEADSETLAAILNDPVYLRQFGLDTSTALCAVIPNTYDFYWNTSAEKVFIKLEKQKEIFWDSTRTAAAQKLGLTPNEVMILASIVEEETNKNSEKPLIASTYLNRLKKGIPLAADPTIKFAMQDFSLKRIYTKYTKIKSPYNTYLHTGLPPGPICTPSIKTIEAVLHAPSTNYLYFCARADFSGYHVFATNYKGHIRNAEKFRRAEDSLDVK